MRSFSRAKKRSTLRTLQEFLIWIETNGHFKVEAQYPPGVPLTPTRIVLTSHENIVSIPQPIWKSGDKMFEPAKGRFDTRMYRLTPKGRKYLRDRGVSIDKDGNIHRTIASVSAPKENVGGRGLRFEYSVGQFLTGVLIDKVKATRQGFYLYTDAKNAIHVVGESGTRYVFRRNPTIVPDQNLNGSALAAQGKVQEKLWGKLPYEVQRLYPDPRPVPEKVRRAKHRPFMQMPMGIPK